MLNIEKAMASHSSTLAWKIPWMAEPVRLQSMGSLRVSTTEQLHFHFSLSCIGEGNGNPLQCSCLENPRDRGAWWAAVSGVAQHDWSDLVVMWPDAMSLVVLIFSLSKFHIYSLVYCIGVFLSEKIHTFPIITVNF